MFPVEIFEEIFKHCDPVDLLRYRRVCLTWNAMIPRIIDKESDMWFKKCRSNIPKWFLSSVRHNCPSTDLDNYSNNSNKNENCARLWKQLWRSWIAWRKLIYTERTVEKFEPLPKYRPDDQITCFTLLGNVVAIGSSEGYVALFDIKNYDNIGTIDAKESVADLQLLGTVDCMGVVISLINKRTKLFTISKKIARLDEEHCYSTGWICASHCGDLFRLSFDNFLITRVALKKGCLSTEVCFTLSPIFKESVLKKAVAAGVVGNYILVWTDGTFHPMYDISKNPVKSHFLTIEPPQVPIRRYQIFKPFVVACIGELGEFGLSTYGRMWKMYNLFKRFAAPVTAILFHVSVLVLGLESGEVHVFPVKDIESLENLNFDVIEFIKHQLDSKAIISLNVTQYDLAQYIVAATIRNVYFIKFQSS